MKVIVCLDDRYGMLFNHRRQSSDRVLCNRIVALTENDILRMNSYSAQLFSEQGLHMLVDGDFLEKANGDDYCFVENSDITPYAEKVNAVIIYRWNRVYPSDVKFPAELFSQRWRLTSRCDFVGNSHERITEEIYTL